MARIFLISLIFSLFANGTGTSGTIPTSPVQKTYLPIMTKQLDLYYYPLNTIHPDNWIAATVPFDANGIPRVDYGGAIGIQYNPTTIGQYALSCWNEYRLTGNGEWLGKFMRQADWLVANRQAGAGGGYKWPYGFALVGYGLAPGWISAISQGLVQSVMRRAYAATQETKYFDTAGGAYRTMVASVAAGGTLATTPEGGIWFEEAPTPSPSLILNGNIFGIIGLHDYAAMSGSAEALALYESAVSSVTTSLSVYDSGTWIVYDRVNFTPITQAYMRIHNNLAEQMTADGASGFRAIWKRWYGYYTGIVDTEAAPITGETSGCISRR